MNDINKIIRKHREDTNFYRFEDLKRESHNPDNKAFSHVCKYSELNKYETECIPVAHYYDDKNNLQIVFSKEPTHCIGIGCTGSGKTTSLVIPKVNILASLKNKPSFFIVDVKGDLFENLSGYLSKRGYDIQVIDLIEPEYSKSWNPFLNIYDAYTKAYDLVSLVKKHQDSIDNYPKLQKFTMTGKETKWYEFEGVAFKDITTLNKAIAHKREKLLADLSGEIKDLAYMFIKSSHNDDPHWDDSARDLFVGVIMAMLERTQLKSPNNLTRNQFNLKNIIDIILSSNDEDLKRFINNCDHNGEAYRYANRLVNMQAEKTKSCYFGVLSSQLSAFKSYAIQKITINNSIDLSSIADKPTAIFMKMDDQKEANYNIAQLIVLRLFQELSNKAMKLPRQRLVKPVHFILDEFGNFPMFQNFANMISVSRSRNIWYTMIIQSYRQLDLKYTEPVARIIIENSNMELFFGSNDFKTKKEFSESCGLIAGISERAYLDGDLPNITNYPIEEFKTVTVSDLSKIEPSEVYIVALGMPVMQSHMERYYLAKEFTPLPTNEYRVIDDIEINSPKYSYSIAQDNNSPSRRKVFRLVYNEEAINVEETLSIDEMKKITMSLVYYGESHSGSMLFFEKEEVDKILPEYIIDALDSYMDSFLNDYEKVTNQQMKIYTATLKRDILKKYIINAKNVLLLDNNALKKQFESDVFKVSQYAKSYLPKAMMFILTEVLNDMNTLTNEEIAKIVKNS